MQTSTVNLETVAQLEKTLLNVQNALDVQIKENMAKDDVVLSLEKKVLEINAEKERYLDDLLKLKNQQVEQFDSINEMQAQLCEKEKRLNDEMAAV